MNISVFTTHRISKTDMDSKVIVKNNIDLNLDSKLFLFPNTLKLTQYMEKYGINGYTTQMLHYEKSQR